MGNRDKWFDFFTGTLTRYLFGNPVRRAGFLILRFGLMILAAPVTLILLLKWAGIVDLTLGPSDIAAAFGVVSLGLAVIILEYIWANRPPPRDQVMLDRLRQHLPREMVDFIRDHQFANGVRLERINGAIELAENWRTVETSFMDDGLQAALVGLVRAAQGMNSIIRQDMRPIEPDSDFMQIRRKDHGYGGERPRDIVARDLRAKAQQINQEYEGLIKRAQHLKLKLSPPKGSA